MTKFWIDTVVEGIVINKNMFFSLSLVLLNFLFNFWLGFAKEDSIKKLSI